MRRVVPEGPSTLGSAVDNNNPLQRSDRPKREEKRVEKQTKRWDDDGCDMRPMRVLCSAVLCCVWPASGLLLVCPAVSLSLSLPSPCAS